MLAGCDGGNQSGTSSAPILGQHHPHIRRRHLAADQLVNLLLHQAPVVGMTPVHGSIHADDRTGSRVVGGGSPQDGHQSSRHEMGRALRHSAADEVEALAFPQGRVVDVHRLEDGFSPGIGRRVGSIALDLGYVRRLESVWLEKFAIALAAAKNATLDQIHADETHHFTQVHSRYHLLEQLLAGVDGMLIELPVPLGTNKIETSISGAKGAQLGVDYHLEAVQHRLVRLEVANVDAST